MSHHKYVIVGGGMTGDAAVKGIREIDPTGSAAMISMEDVAPYARPPLTKGLWKNTPEEKIWKKTPENKVNFFFKYKSCKSEYLY
jgi:3-phenylpropionate/trans-cinnamate dioxygenase ferredoxin reductase component